MYYLEVHQYTCMLLVSVESLNDNMNIMSPWSLKVKTFLCKQDITQNWYYIVNVNILFLQDEKYNVLGLHVLFIGLIICLMPLFVELQNLHFD